MKQRQVEKQSESRKKNLNDDKEKVNIFTCVVQCHILVEGPVSGQVAGDTGVLAYVRRVVDVQVDDGPVLKPVDPLVLGRGVQQDSVLKKFFFSFSMIASNLIVFDDQT